jgi:drug/metabolite transporter (DMT)-like permease
MPFLVGVAIGIAALVAYGLADYFGAISSKRIGGFQTSLVSRFVSLIFVGAIFLIFFHLPQITLQTVAIIGLTGLFAVIGLSSLNKGFQVGNVSLVIPIGNSSSLVTVLLLLLVLGVPIAGLEAVGIAAIIVGTILVSFKLKKLKFKKGAKGLGYAIVAMVCVGAEMFLFVILVQRLGWFIPVVLIYLVMFGYSLIYSLAARTKFPNLKPLLPLVVVVGILAAVAYLAESIGIGLNYPLIVVPLASASAALTAALAFFVLKEKLDFNQKMGMLIILAGLIILSL